MCTTAEPQVLPPVAAEHERPPYSKSPPEPPSFSFIFQKLTVKVLVPTLVLVLTLWNIMQLFVMMVMMPKNDFGRTFLSGVAFVHGEDMYAMNDSIPF